MEEITMTKIGLYGVAGHMGVTIAKAIIESDVCELSGGCERPGSPKIGQDIGALAGLPPVGIEVTDDAGMLCEQSDVIVDYSSAAGTMSLLPVATERNTPVLVCTTGFNDEQVEGQFEWVSGAAINYTNWDIGEPSNAGGTSQPRNSRPQA